VQARSPVFNIIEGDILLVDQKTRPHAFNTPGVSFDGRPVVFSSITGIVLDETVTTDRHLNQRFRSIGIALYDTHLDGDAPQMPYGTAIAISGGVSGLRHRVKNEIWAGDLLVADLGPLDEQARAAWDEELYHDNEGCIEGKHTAVLTPFNPYSGLTFIANAVQSFIANDLNKLSFDVISDTSVPLSDEDVAALQLAQFTSLNALHTLAVLLEAGVITIADDAAAKLRAYKSKKDFAPSTKSALVPVARALGVLNDPGDAAVRAEGVVRDLFGFAWGGFCLDHATYSHYSATRYLPAAHATSVSRTQSSSTAGIYKAFVDAYHDAASRIIVKANSNTLQGEIIDATIYQ